MPVFRVEKNSNYTTMCNYHLKYDHLTERERAVIQMYYIENKMTRKEIADEFEVTELRMRQIISKALRKIRKRANIEITKRQ